MTQSPRFMVKGAFDVPETAQPDSWKVNIEQMLWGHRLINDQTSWLLLLEALAIMSARAADKNVESIFMPSTEAHEEFSYQVPTRKHLRKILFQDHLLDAIARNGHDLSDDAKWERWGEGRDPKDIAYLRSRFEKFSSFHDAVDLLRAAVVEPERDRRPTSRHLVPGGVDMIMADYALKSGDRINNDRKFFARGGELIFLMLNRSDRAAELETLIRNRILTSGSRWNKVARLLQPPVANDPERVQYRVGYLPLPHHPVYNKLANDWIALLSLDQLPDDQLAEPLMRLTGLHIVRYLIERSAETIGRRLEQPIPIDMSTNSAAGLRRVSRERFQLHREMSRLAIAKVIDDFAASAEWQATAEAEDPVAMRKKMIKDVFSHAISPKVTDADTMIEELRSEARSKHSNHLGLMLGIQADRIGLGVSRPGQGRWYAANNGFLEALVLANVSAPVELEQHLEDLWRRYAFVIGTQVGQRELGADAPFEQLRSNQRIYEERLRMLGFVERLSDDCAFVRNPYI